MMNPHQAKTLYEGAANKPSRQIVLRLLASNRFDAGASFEDPAADGACALFAAVARRAILDALSPSRASASEAEEFLEHIGLRDWFSRLEKKLDERRRRGRAGKHEQGDEE